MLSNFHLNVLKNGTKLAQQLNTFRCVSLCGIKLSDKLEPTKPKSEEAPDDNYVRMVRKLHRPNTLERKMLVWTKKYKNESEIPAEVPIETIELARNKSRIKFAMLLMLSTVLGCVYFALSGKNAARRGESVAQMNIDWHKEMNAKPK